MKKSLLLLTCISFSTLICVGQTDSVGMQVNAFIDPCKKDAMGLKSWDINNNLNEPVFVSTPGKSEAELKANTANQYYSRCDSLSLTVKIYTDATKKTVKESTTVTTSNHYITISRNATTGKLNISSR